MQHGMMSSGFAGTADEDRVSTSLVPSDPTEQQHKQPSSSYAVKKIVGPPKRGIKELHASSTATVRSPTSYSLAGDHRSAIDIKTRGLDQGVDIEDLIDKESLEKISTRKSLRLKRAWNSGEDGSFSNGPTFFTDVDAGNEDGNGQIYTLDVASVEQALLHFPDTLPDKSLHVPIKVNVNKIMSMTTDNTMKFYHPRQQSIWLKYFHSEMSTTIIHDGFWFVVWQWFGRVDEPELSPSASSTKLLTDQSRPQSSQTLRPDKKPVVLRSRIQSAGRERTHELDKSSRLEEVKREALSRISKNFVKMFLNIKPLHKDAFFMRYFDGLAQTIFYSLSVAYPESQASIDNAIFKGWLLQLCAGWTLGHVPIGIDISHWKVLRREQKTNSLIHLALAHNTREPRHTLAKKLDQYDGQRVKATKKRQENRSRGHRGSFSNAPGGRGTPSPNLSLSQKQLRPRGPQHSTHSNSQKKKDKILAETSKNSMTSSPMTSPIGSVSLSVMTESGGGGGRSPSPFVAAPPPSRKDPAQQVLPSHLNKDQIPVRVVRQITRILHSDLVQNYLESQGCAASSNRYAITVPMTQPDIVDSPVEKFLEQLKLANTQSQAATAKLRDDYGDAKEKMEKYLVNAKAALRKKKEANEKTLQLKLKDAPAASLELVTEYQNAKYGELKNPSKSLALRRLGHFRRSKEEQLAGSLMNREGGSAVLNKTRAEVGTIADE